MFKENVFYGFAYIKEKYIELVYSILDISHNNSKVFINEK